MNERSKALLALLTGSTCMAFHMTLKRYDAIFKSLFHTRNRKCEISDPNISQARVRVYVSTIDFVNDN